MAALAVTQLIGPVVLHLSWETDPDCQAVNKWHFSKMMQRGDVLREDAEQVANLIHKYDPHETCLVLFCSAPHARTLVRSRPAHRGCQVTKVANSPPIPPFLRTLRNGSATARLDTWSRTW